MEYIFTPPKTNMEPENGPLEKEIPIGNHRFQVPCWISGVYISCTTLLEINSMNKKIQMFFVTRLKTNQLPLKMGWLEDDSFPF